MASPSRRMFVAGSAALSAAGYSRVLGANDRPRIGVIGTGPRGQYLMKLIKKVADIEIAAVCDIYDVRLNAAAGTAGPQAKKFTDHRQVLAQNDIDAVIVATPDHWHAPIAIDACKAGKDIYVEKPVVHTQKDGLALVKAVREHKRIFQAGMQGRGMAQNIEAKQKYVEGGIMGKVGMALTWYTSNRGYIQTAPPGFEKKPEGLNWDRWLGSAPKIPWNPGVYFSPYKWLHYDGGQIMGIAIHVIDTAHFMLNLGKPKAVTAGGGIYFYNDGRDTPDTVALLVDYPENVTLTWVGEVLTAPGIRVSAGVELRGTGGKLYVERYYPEDALQYTPNDRYSKAPAAKSNGVTPHADAIMKNWLECIRSRQKCVGNEEVAYYSTMACIMGSLSYQRKVRVAWDEKWNLPA